MPEKSRITLLEVEKILDVFNLGCCPGCQMPLSWGDYFTEDDIKAKILEMGIEFAEMDTNTPVKRRSDMTIDEAIEILAKAKEHDFPHSVKGYKQSVQLGIEALKLVKVARESPYCPIHLDLPGETKEDDHE